MLGIIIAVRISRSIVDVSYFLLKQHRKKGYMYEALKKFMLRVRMEEPVYVFRMVIAKDNVKSLNLIRKFNPDVELIDDKFHCEL